MSVKNPVVSVANEVSILRGLNGRAYKGPTDGADGGCPVCEECGHKARYVYSDGPKFKCYDCVGRSILSQR
jgi:hypothetical protein